MAHELLDVSTEQYAYDRLAAGRFDASEKVDLSLDKRNTNYALNLQFSNDGTTIIAHGDDQSLYTFVLPPDLLEKDKQPHVLTPHAKSAHASSVHSYAVHPGFQLSDTSTTWALSSCRDVPIQLRNALGYDYRGASYPWIHSTTERYFSAHSLLFLQDGSRFAAGTKGRIAVFDVNADGGTPIVSHITSSRKVDVNSLHDTGLVMALAVSKSGLLATGSTNRNVILYPDSGLARAETAFSLSTPNDVCEGSGVIDLAWSPCEKYLLVAERQSDCVQVFDIRTGGQRLAWLSGRHALTAQRLEMQLLSTDTGSEVWAGGIDGHVRMWSNIGEVEGEQTPSHTVRLGNSPVAAIRWHPQANILATCCGGRTEQNEVSDLDSSDEDSSHGEDAVRIDRKGGHKEEHESLAIWLPR